MKDRSYYYYHHNRVGMVHDNIILFSSLILKHAHVLALVHDPFTRDETDIQYYVSPIFVIYT